jgi:hypothetical protein
MGPIYLIASVSIFAHLALLLFFWHICTKHAHKNDRKNNKGRLPKGKTAFHQTRQQKVYKHVEQAENNEQLYGYQVHCKIGTFLISNN